MGQKNYKNGFKLTVHEDVFHKPCEWKKPQIIFVNSMSDLFHEDIDFKVIKNIFSIMNQCDRHVFQVLTKRAELLAEYSRYLKWTPNIWMGVTVESENYLQRIEYLKKSDAAVKYISFEPLLSDIPSFTTGDIDWVIVGGESGPGCRPMKKEWVVNIQRLCTEKKIPFFFKQWGGFRKKKNGRLLENRSWTEMPITEHVLPVTV